ncbi:MAG: LdpA C-terminal domain-containing domain [Candidatus Gastranaerophilales bacterium]|nr:LdpA C-terminal domain-containing domain [Candidatus Gastranaerophilales bacterium]
MLKDILNKKNCIKIVCGAGNTDFEEVKKIIYVYAKAGADIFDVSANENVINKAKEALLMVKNNALTTVSIGLKEDKHIKKAVINNEKCVLCKKCIEACPQNALYNGKKQILIKNNCVGCRACSKVCKKNAISFEEQNFMDLENIIKYKPDCIELHPGIADYETICQMWSFLQNNFDGMMSINVSSKNFMLLSKIDDLLKITKNRKVMIQADGKSINTGDTSAKSTLQTIALSQLLSEKKLPAYIICSGGTNAKTPKLLNKYEIKVNGIAYGSFARNLIRKFIDKKDFWQNSSVQEKAVKKAEKLILTTKKYL